MLAAVDFNDERLLDAGEIDDVGTERHLATETVTKELPFPNTLPQAPFDLRRIAAQATCAIRPLSARLHQASPTLPSPASGGGAKKNVETERILTSAARDADRGRRAARRRSG